MWLQMMDLNRRSHMDEIEDIQHMSASSYMQKKYFKRIRESSYRLVLAARGICVILCNLFILKIMPGD